MKPSWLRRFALLFFGLLLGSLLALTSIPASASIDESRLSRLESDLSRLESEVNRLSSQIQSVDRPRDRDRPNPVEVPAIARTPSSTLANDPMFDRLATLVVELKRKVDGLEERLVQLEQ